MTTQSPARLHHLARRRVAEEFFKISRRRDQRIQIDATPVAGNFQRVDQILVLGAALVYQPQPWLSCIASYSFEDFNVTFNSAAASGVLQLVPYHNNRLSLSVAIGF